MAFFNEFIPADDVVKYGIEAIDEFYSVFTYDPNPPNLSGRPIFPPSTSFNA